MIKKDINTKNIFLCSFATKNLTYDKNRFLNEALSFNIFKKIYLYDLYDLDKKTRSLIKSSSTQEPKLKGYNHGYFVWKPEIIKKTLDKIPENSFLLYTDIGCFLNLNGKSSLDEYINICDKFSCIGFQYRKPNKPLLDGVNIKYQEYFEFNFTKMEVFDYFNINNKSKIYNSEMMWAGGFLLKKNEITKNFIQEWIDASQIKLLNKEYDKMKNILLKKPRSDQSIFSILFKKYNFKSLCASEEVEWVITYDQNNNQKKNFDHLRLKPIQARRLKKIKLNFWSKLKSFVLKTCVDLKFLKNKERKI
ncbi:hypothetical protein OAO38_04700 [Candidatus Pelagibacter ubique]|nr:hypothetical protein [Candidatus Pelagibacter ubique]